MVTRKYISDIYQNLLIVLQGIFLVKENLVGAQHFAFSSLACTFLIIEISKVC